jgi:hypothetical protein
MPLFFVAVKTNTDYKVVATFILQTESEETIKKALQVLCEKNPEWKPEHCIVDYSDAEINAIRAVFPDALVLLCDFHREQAWERYAKAGRHSLSKSEQKELLEHLRIMAMAETSKEVDTARNLVLSLEVFKKHKHVQRWLNQWWFGEENEKLWVRTHREGFHGNIDTNNGVERQNRTFKEKYLVNLADKSLSSMIQSLIKNFIPDQHMKYLDAQYMMTSDFREYHANIPKYLHGLPERVIRHCLVRKGNALALSEDDVSLDRDNGIIWHRSQSKEGVSYAMRFPTTPDGMFSCDCRDFKQQMLPCKHFFNILKVFDGQIEWGHLGAQFLSLPHMSMDAAAVEEHLAEAGASQMDVDDSFNSLPEENVSERDFQNDNSSNQTFDEILQLPSFSRALKSKREAVKILATRIQSSVYRSDSLEDLQLLYSRLNTAWNGFRVSLPDDQGLELELTSERLAVAHNNWKNARGVTELRLGSVQGRKKKASAHRKRVGASASAAREEEEIQAAREKLKKKVQTLQRKIGKPSTTKAEKKEIQKTLRKTEKQLDDLRKKTVVTKRILKQRLQEATKKVEEKEKRGEATEKARAEMNAVNELYLEELGLPVSSAMNHLAESISREKRVTKNTKYAGDEWELELPRRKRHRRET